MIAELVDGRIHAQHGPIDLIVTIDASHSGRVRALADLRSTFAGLLEELVIDLELLRLPANVAAVGTGCTAQRMIDATVPFAADSFITPMAAVAGSVADTVCDAMWNSATTRLIVNNGGDIAFKLAPGTSMTVGLADVLSGGLQGGVQIGETDPVRGVATSGRHGRSLSMGIADSVTAFAMTAAAADAAATMIANTVTIPDSPQVTRRKACDVDANSDLGEHMVVTHVAHLNRTEKEQAIAHGRQNAMEMIDRGLVRAVAIKLDDHTVTVGDISAHPHSMSMQSGQPEFVLEHRGHN